VISTLLAASLLWTVVGDGIILLVTGLVIMGSGLTVPLPLCPTWLQQTLNWLPFRGLMDTPYRLYLGHAPVAEAPSLLMHQLAWTIALAAVGWDLTRRGLRRLVIHGG